MKTFPTSISLRVPLLSLCGVLLGASCALAQNAPQNPPTGEATAFAQIGDAAPKKRFLVPPPNAPLDVPLQPTSYAVPSGAIFVSPDARPNGAGTQNSPATLKDALQKATEGATIVLRGGLYRDGNLVIPHRMTLQAFPNELPWIDGSDIVTGWQSDGTAWRHDNWNFAFPPIFDAKDIEPAYPLANNRDMVWLNGRYLTQVGTRVEVGPSKFFVDYGAKKLYIGDDPAGKTVEATTRANGLMLRPRDAAKVAGSMIRGLGLRRFADAGLQVSAPRVVIENSVAAWNGIFGAQITGNGASDSTTDVVLRGFRASCNGKAGVRSWGTPRLFVENSTFTHNNVENYRRAWGAAGLKLGNGSGLVFRNNTVADNYSFGLWLDENANDATVVNNIMRGNEVAGIMFEISHRALIAFNVVHDNNVGVMVSNATAGNIWNNTFADNKTAVNIKQWRRPNHQTPDDPNDLFLTREIVLKNNLFAQTKPNAKNIFVDAGKGAGAAPQMITASDFNAYVTSTPLQMVQWLAEGKMSEYGDLNSFRAASGQEKNGVAATLNPFVDAAKGNYRLKPGVIVGAAQPLPAEVAAATKAGANVGFGALGS